MIDLKKTAAEQSVAKEVLLGDSPSAISDFNGTSDRIEIAYSAEFNPRNFTVEMWVEFQGGMGYRAILSSVSGSELTGRQGYLFCVNPAGQWQFWVGNGQKGFPWIILTGTPAKQGVWTHIAGSYDSQSQTALLFVNGKTVAQRVRIQVQPNDRYPLFVGAGATKQPGASPCFFHGRIAGLKVWNKALSATEIQALANQRSPGDSLEAETDTTPVIESIESDPPELEIEETPPAEPSQSYFEEWHLIESSEPDFEEPELEPIPPIESPQLLADESEEIKGDRASHSHDGKIYGATWTIAKLPIAIEEGSDLSPLPPSPARGGGNRERETSVKEIKISTASLQDNIDISTLFLQDNIKISTSSVEENTDISSLSPPSLLGKKAGGLGFSSNIESPTSLQAVLSFDGEDDYIEIADPFANNTEFTISLWIQPSMQQRSPCGIMGKRWCPHFFKPELWLIPDRGVLYYQSCDADAPQTSCSAPLFHFFDNTESDWIHITWVKQGTTYKFYKNGELFATKPAPKRVYTDKGSYWFGKLGTAGAVLNFGGQMADIRIWNVARSQVEICSDMHQRLSGNEIGLSYYWPLNEGAGDSVYNSANSNAERSEMTIATSESIWGEYPLQPAIAFDGERDYIEINDPFENDMAFTISLWVKPNAIADRTWHGILGKQSDRFCKPGLSICPYDRALHYQSYDADRKIAYRDVLIHFFEASDRWIHITWVKDGTEYRFYRNGELFASKPAPPIFYRDRSPYWLGKSAISEAIEGFFAGQMADVRFWNLSLGDAEIQADLHDRLLGDEFGLSYYWPLNEGSGEIVCDRVKNDRGTIVGATWQQSEVPMI